MNTQRLSVQTFGKSCVICLMFAPFGPMINRWSQRSTATSFSTTLFAYIQHISIICKHKSCIFDRLTVLVSS